MSTRTNILSNGKTANPTVSFTLPITCQICLGKVKEPCVCPNLHAFCSFCIDIWLEKTKQCPTCRIPIDKDNPCRRIVGGIENADDVDFMKPTEFSHPSTRKARFFNMFQQYEEEITRLNNYIESLSDDIKKLRESSKHNSSHLLPQHDMIQLLKTKLQHTQNSYDEITRERDVLREQNKKLDSENSILIQDISRLKTALNEKNSQIASKYAMAALESKIESYEKEIKQLQKALDKSDKYISELEFKKELKDKENKLKWHITEEAFNSNSLNGIATTSSSAFTKPTSVQSSLKLIKSDSQNLNKNVKFSEKIDKYPSPPTVPIKKNVIPKDNFYGSPNKNATYVPSTSMVCDRLKKNLFNTQNGGNFDFEPTNHLSQSMLTMNASHSANLLQSNSSNSFTNHGTTHSFLFSPMKRLRLDEVNLEKPEVEIKEDTKNNETDNLSGSNEFIDCMAILNRAEKNVQNRQISPSKTKFVSPRPQYAQLNETSQNQSDSSANSPSSSGNSLSANGASSLSSFSNGISSDSSSNSFSNKFNSTIKKNPSVDKNMGSLTMNSYSLNSYQNNPQADFMYKEYGQSLNYANNSGINVSLVNRSRSVDPSVRSFK